MAKRRVVADLLEIVAEPAFEQFRIFMEEREEETVQHRYGIPPALTKDISVGPSRKCRWAGGRPYLHRLDE